MQGWKWAATLSYSIMLASLFIIVIFPLVWEVRLLLGALIVASGYACDRTTRWRLSKLHEQRQRQRQAENERHFVRIMNHVRHQWMNELQILYGYIQLKKYDKLQCALEKIKAKAQQESFISRLGIPSLVAFLFYYRAQHQVLQLEVEMLEEIDLRELPLRSRQVAELIQEIILAFEQHAGTSGVEPNVLSLELELEEDGLVLDFIFRGSTDAAGLKQTIGRILLEYALDAMPELQEYEATKAALAIRAPFQSDSKEVKSCS